MLDDSSVEERSFFDIPKGINEFREIVSTSACKKAIMRVTTNPFHIRPSKSMIFVDRNRVDPLLIPNPFFDIPQKALFNLHLDQQSFKDN